MKKKLLVIGNGMVTGRFLDELMRFVPHNYQVTVLSAEPFGSYNRIMLSSVLSGEASIQEIIQKPTEWYKKNNIKLLYGDAAVHIDGAKKQVRTKNDRIFAYDHLVIATGSRSAKIPAGNQQLKNIFPFRSIADTENMLDKAATAQSAVVIGGGFLGLEAAWGLAKRGVKVTVIHRSKHLLNRQLDQTAAQMLQDKLEDAGLTFFLQSEVTSFVGNEQLQGAELKSGERLTCDMAIIATGITPNAELGWDARLSGSRAIAVDGYMQTSDPHISAIGECVEIEGKTFGLVDPLWQHAKILATRLCETDPSRWLFFTHQHTATKLKISGLQLYSAGLVDGSEGVQPITIHDPKANIYRKLNLKDGKIIGIVLFGDVRSGSWYFDLMEQKEDVSQMLPKIIFGQEYFMPSDSTAS